MERFNKRYAGGDTYPNWTEYEAIRIVDRAQRRQRQNGAAKGGETQTDGTGKTKFPAKAGNTFIENVTPIRSRVDELQKMIRSLNTARRKNMIGIDEYVLKKQELVRALQPLESEIHQMKVAFHPPQNKHSGTVYQRKS